MTVASTLVPRWWLVTKPRKAVGELIGSADFRRPRPPPLLDEPASADAFFGGGVAAAVADFFGREPDVLVEGAFLACVGADFFALVVVAGALVAGVFFAARVARRLTGPRTGTLATKTHPTPGTGLPPQSRPSEKSHS